MEAEQRRQHPRYAIALKVTITAGDRTIEAESKDLSRGGISLMAAQPLQVSDVVDLSIALVFGDNTFSEPLKVPAVIVWCTKMGAAYQLGAKFTRPAKETRDYLDVFLKFLEGDLDDEFGEEGDTQPGERRTR